MTINNSLYEALNQLAYHNKGPLRYALPVLAPLSKLYGAGQRIRRRLYRSGWLQASDVGVPVISVGNLTVGGVGKTPFTIYLAQTLLACGYKPGLLYRGYARESNSPVLLSKQTFHPQQLSLYGDEPSLACFKTGLTVGIGSNRTQSARQLLGADSCDVLIMDDGFQHLQLKRDVDIVLLDGNNPIGNGWCLPAGPLREPPSALFNADGIVVCHAPLDSSLNDIQIKHQFYGDLQWQALRPFRSWLQNKTVEDSSLPEWNHQPVILVSAIGNPERLEWQALAHKITVRRHFRFLDHHWLSQDDLDQIERWDPRLPIITTEKDAIRFWQLYSKVPNNVLDRLWVIVAQFQLQDEESFFLWLRERLNAYIDPSG